MVKEQPLFLNSNMGCKEMSRILVTGSNGFLGRNFISQAIDNGHEVICVDSGLSVWDCKLRSYSGDIKDRDFLKELFEEVGNNLDYVFHFAAIADISESTKESYNTIATNIFGTVNILEEITNYPNIKRFFFASSMYVYNDSGSFYRATKQSCEILIKEYSKKFNISYTMMRYGSLYGLGAQDWNGLKSMVRSAIKDGVINHCGTGEEIRDYINIVDASKVTLKCLSDEYVNRSIMITGTQTVTLQTVMDMIVEILGEDVSIKKDNSNGERYCLTPYRFNPDSATKVLIDNYKDLGEGIFEVIGEVHSGLDV